MPRRSLDLPPSDAQVKINLDGRIVYLDRLFREEQVNVELDGAKWHRSAADRERDLRRDSRLMARGLLVVRFTHARLMAESDDVRRDLRGILSRRRDRGVA
jgi:very-short-patch-repair endonuclease